MKAVNVKPSSGLYLLIVRIDTTKLVTDELLTITIKWKASKNL